MKNRNLPRDDNWATPLSLYNKLNVDFDFDFDPCLYAENGFPFDGLSVEWGQRNFVNPPYSLELKTAFVLKGIEEFKKGKLVVFLLPVSTSTVLFHESIYKKAEIRFLRGRVKFQKILSDGTRITPPNGPMHDSMVVIFNPKKEPIMSKTNSQIDLELRVYTLEKITEKLINICIKQQDIMIWKKKIPPIPKAGELKIKTKFAFFPTEIDDNQIIWLNFYEKHYQCHVYDHGFSYNWILEKTIPKI